jgi:hypothetical protein
VDFLEDSRFTVLQILSLTKWFFIQSSIMHDNISSQVVDSKDMVLTNGWTHPSLMTMFIQLFLQSVIWKVTIVTLSTMWHSISYLVYLSDGSQVNLTIEYMTILKELYKTYVIHKEWKYTTIITCMTIAKDQRPSLLPGEPERSLVIAASPPRWSLAAAAGLV